MTPEETIRRALEAEASTVDVRPDALATIRARTRRRRTRSWIRAWTGAGLAVAAAAAVVVVALDAPRPAPPPSATPAPATTPAAGGALLAVYYLGPGGTLVREFHRLRPAADTPADRARAALAEMFAAAPADPDYTSAWPAGSAVRGVSVTGDAVAVDLAGATPPTPVAAQQLVWTVTAASGLTVVRIGTGPPLRRAAAVDTLAPVWLINPQQGETVRGAVDVHVAAFAPAVRLRARDAAGAVVFDREVTLSGGSPAQREAHLTVPLPPGGYTLSVSVAGGSDDHVVHVD